jgi:hypothetical protein
MSSGLGFANLKRQLLAAKLEMERDRLAMTNSSNNTETNSAKRQRVLDVTAATETLIEKEVTPKSMPLRPVVASEDDKSPEGMLPILVAAESPSKTTQACDSETESESEFSKSSSDSSALASIYSPDDLQKKREVSESSKILPVLDEIWMNHYVLKTWCPKITAKLLEFKKKLDFSQEWSKRFFLIVCDFICRLISLMICGSMRPNVKHFKDTQMQKMMISFKDVLISWEMITTKSFNAAMLELLRRFVCLRTDDDDNSSALDDDMENLLSNYWARRRWRERTMIEALFKTLFDIAEDGTFSCDSASLDSESTRNDDNVLENTSSSLSPNRKSWDVSIENGESSCTEVTPEKVLSWFIKEGLSSPFFVRSYLTGAQRNFVTGKRAGLPKLVTQTFMDALLIEIPVVFSDPGRLVSFRIYNNPNDIWPSDLLKSTLILKRMAMHAKERRQKASATGESD